MHTHIQPSIPLAIVNATMHILLPHHNTTYISDAMSSNNIQLSDSAIAVALPYSGESQSFNALLTRHPQYSQAVNICFLILVLTWAFWERITEAVEAFDDWLVEETMKEDQRVWREGYWGARRNLKLVGILKRGCSGEGGGGVDGDSDCENGWAKIGNERRRNRVSFAEDVKDFDGERGDGCWDLVEGVMDQEVDSLIRHLCTLN